MRERETLTKKQNTNKSTVNSRKKREIRRNLNALKNLILNQKTTKNSSLNHNNAN